MAAKKSAAKVPYHAIQPSRRVIQLDQSQYQLYLNGQIQIYSPDAMLLDTIGEQVKSRQEDEDRTRLTDQLSLLECLVVTSTGELQLTDRALAGLSDLLRQAQNEIG